MERFAGRSHDDRNSSCRTVRDAKRPFRDDSSGASVATSDMWCVWRRHAQRGLCARCGTRGNYPLFAEGTRVSLSRQSINLVDKRSGAQLCRNVKNPANELYSEEIET